MVNKKEHYTVDEMDEHFDKFIKNSADDLIEKLRETRKNKKVVSKKKEYA